MAGGGAITAVLLIAIAALAVAFGALVVALSHRDSLAVARTSGAAPQVVSLTDFQINVPTTIVPSDVKFHFTNDGKVAHEVLVFATDLQPADFPKQPDGTVNEDGAGMNKVSDGENIDPAGSQDRSVDLTKPGTYVFLCNLPGHFAQGMYATVTVK